MRIRRLAASGLILCSAMAFDAVAQSQSYKCPDGYVCLWQHSGYQGGFYAFRSVGYGTNFAGRYFDNGVPIDNNASSLWNRSRYTHRYYTGPNRTGGFLTEPAGSYRYNLAIDGFNDAFSSISNISL